MKKPTETLRIKLRTSEFKDVKLEKYLISSMLQYPEVMRKCSESVNSQLFSSDRLQWIYTQIVEFFNNEGLTLDKKGFEIKLSKKAKVEHPAIKKLFNSILKIKDVKPSTALSAIPKLEKMYDARLIEFGLQETIKSLSKSLEDGGENYIDEAIKNYKNVADVVGKKKLTCIITDPITKYREFKKEHKHAQLHPELYMGIPTGIQELDNRMKGLRPSEFGIVTAGTGVGKSIFLLDIGFNCYMKCGDILYVTIEMPEKQLRERFYCRLSGIDYSYFRGYELEEKHWFKIDRKIKNLRKHHDNKFYILDMPQSCDVMTLRNEIESFIKKTTEPKLIIVDYINIMQGGFDWNKQLENAVGIKQQIARYFKIATWSANQLAGSKHDKEVIKVQDMGFAKHIADNADVGIGIGLTDLSEDEGIFTLSFTKTRDFSAKGFQIQGDRGLMTFSGRKKKSKKKKKFKKTKLGEEIKV